MKFITGIDPPTVNELLLIFNIKKRILDGNFDGAKLTFSMA